MIPGQDLGVKLQAFLGWLGNYGHLPYQKQQEMLWELGKIEIGMGQRVNTNQRLFSAIKPHVEQLSNWVKTEQPSIHVDEAPCITWSCYYWYTSIHHDLGDYHNILS